jgi:LPPG:FO 2-phospho-L-lactate transferase
LSIAPILSIPGLSDLIRSHDIPRVVVTPIIGGTAVKGPTAKIMGELGLQVTGASIVDFYGDVINGFVNDVQNRDVVHEQLRTVKFDTLMKDLDDKLRLGESILTWIKGW